ncbi:MAG: hypothetical protein M1351_01425 [Candidatus Thermoplasmatota archaeon]|nr:hypothetical protein [Candidatus Thermoplasmatota archaeon]
MKTTLRMYFLTINDVKLLKELSFRPLTVNQASVSLGVTPGLSSRVIHNLESKGFVSVIRKGSSKEVRLSKHLHAQYFSDLIKKEPFVAWEKVLSYSKLGALMRSMGFFPDMNFSRTTDWRITRDIGALAQPNYRNSSLKEFLRVYADYITRDFASKKFPPYAALVWNRGFRYLIRVPAGKGMTGNLIPTAISVFPHFGISLVTEYDYYFYNPSHDVLSVEDYIVHTLLIDPGSTIYITYAILLLLRSVKLINRVRLMQTANDYSVTSSIQAMIDYIDTNGRKRSSNLPPYEELLEKAALYGVKAN